MMIFIISISIIVILSVIGFIYYKKHKRNIIDGTMFTKWEWFTFFGAILFIANIILSFACLIGLAITNMIGNVEFAELQAQREMLIYRIENEDNFLEDAQLKREVMDFNIRVRGGKQARNDIWINWFSSPAYDDIEEIKISFKK